MSDAESARGRLVPPDLDDRRWQDLVDEARALIPKYAPQWTDHNPSDLGITLVELFAWLVEGLIYRLNRVPEKNYVAFLDLLGITRRPARPSQTLLTFTAQPGASPDVPQGTRAQTQSTEAQEPLVVETEHDLRVVPLTPAAAVLVEQPDGADGPRYRNLPDALPPAAGGVRLDLGAGASAQVCLGFEPAQADHLDLSVGVGRWQPPDAAATVDWVASAEGAADPGVWPPVAVQADHTAGLRRQGLVRIALPAAWAEQAPPDWSVPPAPGTEPVTASLRWVGLRVTNAEAALLQVRLTHLLVNTVPATSTGTVPATAPEELGRADGSPFQVFALRNRPVYRRRGTDASSDHVTVTVDGVPWTLVADLAPGAQRQYRLDPVAGEVAFGNHDPTTGLGHGEIPAAGAVVEAAYRYVAVGAAGNVPAGAISALATPVQGVIGVRNAVPGTGGEDEEPVAATKRRAPALLRTRNRAVTAEDYEYLVREVAPETGAVRCLEPRLQAEDNGTVWRRGDPWRFAGLLRAPGVVTVVCVPDLGPGASRPEPSPSLVREVRQALDRRGDLTTHLHVTGPRYLPVRVHVDARIFRRAVDEGRIESAAQAYADLAARVERFLHPIHGGVDGDGWEVGESVFLADAYQAIRPPDAIGYIASLQLEAMVPPYHDPPIGPGGQWNPDERPLELGGPGPLVRLADYELVCFGDSRIPQRPLE